MTFPTLASLAQQPRSLRRQEPREQGSTIFVLTKLDKHLFTTEKVFTDPKKRQISCLRGSLASRVLGESYRSGREGRSQSSIDHHTFTLFVGLPAQGTVELDTTVLEQLLLNHVCDVPYGSIVAPRLYES